MSCYLLSVYHPDGVHEREFGAYETAADMEAAFARVAEFNASLSNAGLLEFAAGLGAPITAVTVDPDGALSSGPGFAAEKYLGGFWVIRVADDGTATRIAAEAAAACGQAVEVRCLAGEDDEEIAVNGSEGL